MNDIKLTIIMSNYNQEKFISHAIESILMQKVNFKYQLIITDDYSQKDNSIKIIKEYAEKYPEIIMPIFNNENGGYLKNILRAKAITKTPYFCLLDADDYYTDPNFLQRAFDFLQNNSAYVIYYENVECVCEDGSKHPFIDRNIKENDYVLEDYFNDKIPIVQTTGQFFRNVIFKNGIPAIMSESVGTESERSFEGDFDRFIMHLKFGEAHYNNVICGVYRVLSSGIWCKLDEIKKNIVQLQCWYDYNRYFENTHKDFFVNKMYLEIKKIQQYINYRFDSVGVIELTESEISQIKRLYNFIVENKLLLNVSDSFQKTEKKSLVRKVAQKVKKMINYL